MDDEASSGLPGPNEILNALLECVDDALWETRQAANGMPLFSVEAVLTERLHAVLPSVRFTAQDIRTWSAEISS